MSAAAASRDITLVRFLRGPSVIERCKIIHLSNNSWQKQRDRWTVIVACCEPDLVFVKEFFIYIWSNFFFWLCAFYDPSWLSLDFFFIFFLIKIFWPCFIAHLLLGLSSGLEKNARDYLPACSAVVPECHPLSLPQLPLASFGKLVPGGKICGQIRNFSWSSSFLWASFLST